MIRLIVITKKRNSISIVGHAGFAPHGQDIVCAAISTLTLVFVASIEELTEDNIRTDIRAGNAVIEYKNLSDRAQVLMDSFLLGLEIIAQNYPHHVRIVTV